MKKLVLLFISAVLLTACSGKDETQAKQNFPPCTINGHDCWGIVQVLEQTKTISPSQEEIDIYIETHYPLEETNVMDAKTGKPLLKRNLPRLGEYEIYKKLTHYNNTKLQEIGLTITDIGMFSDGGSIHYAFSNGTTIFKKWKAMGPDLGWANTTISFPTLESFVLNKKGEIIDHTPAQDCIVNRTSCAELAQLLNRFFIDKPTLEKYPCGRGNNKRECYNGITCDKNNFCTIGFRSSDQQLVGVSAENSQQTGETYTYTLDDGRTLVFNWEPNDPEHGFLTVIETDGTQKKFNPQGNLVE